MWGVATAVLLLIAAHSANATQCFKFKTAGGDCANITLPGNHHDNPGATGKTLVCSLCPSKNGIMVYRPANGDTRFTANNFRQVCLGNAGVSCADPSNTLSATDSTKSCCSCYLYARFCGANAGKNGGKVLPYGNGQYVIDRLPLAAHSMVMPTGPCTGIDNWNVNNANFRCPKEDIWDAARSVLVDAQKNGTYGMAINPVQRRGQNQMHVHLAQLFPSLLSTLAYAVNSLRLSMFYLDCGLQDKAMPLQDCKLLADGVQPNVTHPQVIIRANHAKASAATPFTIAYGTSPNNTNPNVLLGSLLVTQVPLTNLTLPNAPSWALVINRQGPAECFFVNNGDDSLIKAC